MQTERKAKVSGEIILGEDCNFDDMVKDVFTCIKRHNASPKFRIYEILQNEQEVRQNNAIKDLIESALNKKNR